MDAAAADGQYIDAQDAYDSPYFSSGELNLGPGYHEFYIRMVRGCWRLLGLLGAGAWRPGPGLCWGLQLGLGARTPRGQLASCYLAPGRASCQLSGQRLRPQHARVPPACLFGCPCLFCCPVASYLLCRRRC
jgi:hypothetical protein